MAAEFEEGLAWLADVEDADDVRVCGEGGEEVEVVGGGGEAEERGWGGEGGFAWAGGGVW